VLYTGGTFSKVLFPGLRLAYLVVAVVCVFIAVRSW
jgi:DNA-binding transcriptional MocR family regulator